MLKYRTIVAALTVAAGIAGCEGGDGSPGPSSSSSTTVSFPKFVSNDVTTETCDMMSPTEIDPIDFTFDADQDTAEPITADDLPVPGCSS